MPYESDAQRRYFNANRDELEAQGVDVDEWNDSSRGKKLPERSKKKRKKKASISLGTSQVHGTGLFTTEDIKQGTKFARAMVRMRGKDAQSRYELTKAARYTNHSQDPSAQMVKAGNEIYLVALKDIPANAEVLVDYRKTASVLGPGSYITFKGEKRATWDALEKQAQEGVSFRDRLGDMDPTARNALLIGGAGALAGGGAGLLGSLGGPGRTKIDAGMAAHLLNQGVPAATVRKLQEGVPLNDLDRDMLTRANVDLDEIAPKGSYLGNMLGNTLSGGTLGGLVGAGLGGGITELERAVITPAELRERATRGGAEAGQRLQSMLPGWVPDGVRDAGQALTQGAGQATGSAAAAAYKQLPRAAQFEVGRGLGKSVVDLPLTAYDKLFGKESAVDPIDRALKQADMLKDLGEGVAKGVEGLAGAVGKTLEEKKKEDEEEKEEQEKLEKAVKRNVRERKARKIAKRDAWKHANYGPVGPAMALELTTADIQHSTNQLRNLLAAQLNRGKKKKRSSKNYPAEMELQRLRSTDKLMFEQARHDNLMAELEMRKLLAEQGVKAAGILPETGPVASALEYMGVKKKKEDKEKEKQRRKGDVAAQGGANLSPGVKMGTLLAKKRLKIEKDANLAASRGSYPPQQPSLTGQRQNAHQQMNAQAAGAGSQQPTLTPEQQQVLAQRPQAQPSASQRPLNPTVANLGAGPLTGDQFGPGAQSGLGMALTASAINGQGDLIDRALRSIEKQAYGGSDGDFEYDRYLDMGVPYVMAQDPKRMAAFTQAFADSAKQQGAELGFTSERHAEGDMTPEQAIGAISNYEGDLTEAPLGAEDESLPYYYTMKYPRQARKGLLQKLRLRSPEAIESWPSGHPFEEALKILTDKERKAYEDDVGIPVDYDPSAGEKHHDVSYTLTGEPPTDEKIDTFIKEILAADPDFFKTEFWSGKQAHYPGDPGFDLAKKPAVPKPAWGTPPPRSRGMKATSLNLSRPSSAWASGAGATPGVPTVQPIKSYPPRPPMNKVKEAPKPPGTINDRSARGAYDFDPERDAEVQSEIQKTTDTLKKLQRKKEVRSSAEKQAGGGSAVWPLAAGSFAGLGLPYLLDHNPSPGTVLGSMAGGTALGGLAMYLKGQAGAKKQRKQLKSKKQEELTEQELRDLAALDDLAAPRASEKRAETPELPLPTDLIGHGIAGGLAGAPIGALLNALKGRSLKRGAITGGLTGAGALSGLGLGANLSRSRPVEFLGGWGGTGLGGYGGYELAQKLQGPDEEEEEKRANVDQVQAYMEQGFSLEDAVRAAYPDWSDEQVAQFVGQQKQANTDPIERLLSVTKTAVNRQLGKVPTQGSGPEQISNALNLYGQSRTLAAPTDKQLQRAGLTRTEFEDTIDDLAARRDTKFNFRDLKADPKVRALLGGLAGALGGGWAGYLAGGAGTSIGGAGIGGGLGAGAGYLSAGPHNRKLLGAAKMLKDYGLLSPKLLRTAHPVIGRPKFAGLAAKKQRRNAGPRSVTIKKPQKKDPDTGEVVPGSSYITHVNRAGKKIKK